MIKFTIKSIFLYGVLAVIAVLVYAFCFSFRGMLQFNFFSFICIPAIGGALVWLFTRLLTVISTSISFMYWLFCVGLVVALRFISGSEVDLFSTIASQATILMFLIPELEGEWITYLNTETYYDGYGRVTSETSWTSSEYNPGCLKKLIAISILTFVLAFLGLQNNIWASIIFWVEIAYASILALINVKNFFFS